MASRPAHRPARRSVEGSLPPRLAAVLRDELATPAAREILDHWHRRSRYDPRLCRRLIAVARGDDPWPVRRLATLLLEHQILLLDPERLEDVTSLLVGLGLAIEHDGGWTVPETVLTEGFTTTEPVRFFRQLRRRLARLERIHAPLRRPRREIDADALDDFLFLAERDCRLTLARYLFQPDEVARRVRGDVNLTRGVARPLDDGWPREEAARARLRLPAQEARLLEHLLEHTSIYWVSERTGSTPESLIEYPKKSAALVVKPPGSDREFEFKRAGKRGRTTLGVVWQRDGRPVSPGHRLDGGDSLPFLQWEARSAALFARIFRRVHRREAPLSTLVATHTVLGVPGVDGEQPLALYLSDPERFGDGYEEMRESMARSVDALDRERDWSLSESDLPEELGLTVRFISHTTPTQGLLIGTTSFRVELLAEELGGDDAGDDDPAAARRAVDALLDEILGVYEPPAIPFRDRAGYVDAALARPANRRRADAIFLSINRQIAEVWGTLLGVRGYTYGESFVARNVGLRSVWRGGRWRVEIRFMDHDNLRIPAAFDGWLRPRTAVSGMVLDEAFIVGDGAVQGTVAYLEEIYRAGSELRARAAPLFRATALDAYRRTQRAVRSDPFFRELFQEPFIERLHEWDEMVRESLPFVDDDAGREVWRARAREKLEARGYGEELAAEHVAALEDYRYFLQRHADLFQLP